MSTVGSNDLIERLTLGVATTLEKRPGVNEVLLSNHSPAERHRIIAWEQKNTCMLPDDLKNFYLTTNGLLLTWKVNVEGTNYPVGRMEVNSIENLKKISSPSSTVSISNKISLADIDYSSDSEDDQDDVKLHPPHFDGRARIFELDPCSGFGKVCLVYKKATPGLPANGAEIWFLDRSLSWSFLALNFETYYRLMLMHLGLPQWQYAFTPVGLSPKAKEWFNAYAPVRLQLNENLFSESEMLQSKPNHSLKVDFGKVFRGKSDRNVKAKLPTSTSGAASKKKQGVGLTRPPIKSMAGQPLGRNTKPWN